MTLKRSHVIGALGGALTMTAIMAVPAYADTLTDETTNATNEESILYTEGWNQKAAANVESYAVIRAAASSDSEQTGVLLPGRAVTVEGQEGDWSRVSSDGVEGYIRSDLLVFGEEARVHYQNVCGFTGTVTASSLRVRTQPSLEAETIGSLGNNRQVKVLGAEGEWYQVSYNGSSAYVYSDYVSLENAVQGAMTVDEYQESQSQAVSGSAVSADSGDLAMLAALIECEAGGESYTGKVAVGAVVLNRVRSGSFPNDIAGVIYQSGQFSPVSSGKFQSVLSRGARSDCYEAAAAALAGENPVGNCLYFNSGSGRGIQIGNQHFY
ncbi:MAG: cell wall hydrolase [Lachnospiraceae bacterium]|nr:cell wall hydrolase [Lachnospiraceae bacterium]